MDLPSHQFKADSSFNWAKIHPYTTMITEIDKFARSISGYF